MRLFAGFWGCLLMAIGCLLWLDHRDRWDYAWLYFSLPLLFAGSIAWDLWTHKGQTMNFSKEFKEELLSRGLLLFSTAWFLLGFVNYMRDGSWAYLTLPLFAVAAAWLRARKRQRGKPVDDVERKPPELYDLVAKALTPFGTRRRDAAKSSTPLPRPRNRGSPAPPARR